MGKGDRKKKIKPTKAMAEAFALPQPKARPMMGRPPQPDLQVDTLRARARILGMGSGEEVMRDMKSPWWGCAAGCAMARAIGDHQERLDLWDAIQHMRRVQMAYDRAMGSPSRHAQVLRMLTPPDTMEADASSPALDDRTDEERQRHAVSALMALEGWLGYTDKAARSECLRVVLDDALCVDPVGLLSALRCVSDGVKGVRMVWRGRA